MNKGRLARFTSLVLLTLALSPSGAQADYPGLNWDIPNPREVCSSSAKNVNTCLQASLGYRCMNYGEFAIFNTKPIRNCYRAVSKLIERMDLIQVKISEKEKNKNDHVENSGLLLKQVLFAHENNKIFNAKETQDNFRAAAEALDDSVRFGRKNNLWDAVFSQNYFNREKSMKFISIALQDVSAGMWNVVYLKRAWKAKNLSPETLQMKNIGAAEEFIMRFQMNLKSEKPAPFSAYPELGGMERDLHPYLHHFYLPAFLASELLKAGKNDEDAFFAGFLLNTGYEFVKLEAKLGKSRWPFFDPKPFNEKKSQLQLQKIYTGYVGALWGIGRESYALSYKEFSREMSKDPFGFMKTIFKARF